MAEEAARAQARRAERLAALAPEPEPEPELERPEVSAALGSDELQATPLMVAAHGDQVGSDPAQHWQAQQWQAQQWHAQQWHAQHWQTQQWPR